MPLVLAENEATESGISYDDRTGVSYQYPRAYRRLIQAGERFVYYRGRKKLSGGRAPQVYFGTGVVGSTSEDARDPGRLVCEVLDYQPFTKPIPFKDSGGRYLENGGSRRRYFQRGVRRISDGEFQRVLSLADGVEPAINVAAHLSATSTFNGSYATPAFARLIDEFAMRAALADLRRRFPTADIKAQPRNNPGFDVLITDAAQLTFVEVKGTSRSLPHFFVTEGELQFSRRFAQQYRLLVVYRIDLAAETYALVSHEGAISAEQGFALKPIQWACAMHSEHSQGI